ncbi:probable glutamate receptor [Coccinella septempunctata]|uniref:probable glutamate receptor n=1 Tax=Coccinella septempunctata TaxID=41139 RepID=UPI001D07A1F9|nr:probable glutamate receptor [Coccinella septempunctata]
MREQITFITSHSVKLYLDSDSCVLLIIDQKSTLTYAGNHQIIILSISKNLTDVSENIEEIIFKFQYGCRGFIIDTKKPSVMFEFIEEKIKHSLVRFNTRKYLIVVEEKIENYDEIFRKLPSSRYVSNLLFLVQKTAEEFQFWSPSFEGSADGIRFEQVDTWLAQNGTFLLGNDLFPDKLRDQQGRYLRMACFHYAPYTNCGGASELNEYYGTELKLVIEFTRLYNLTPKFVYNDIEEELWGALYPNWTGSGLMGRVLRDEADIAFTAFYIWEFVYHYMDLSMPYIRSGITCLVPKPKILNGWLTPLFSYKATLWILVIANFVFNVLLLFHIVSHLQKEYEFNTNKRASFILLDAFWILLKISLGQTFHGRKNSFIIIERLVLASFFLVYLILNSAYFSGLASIMTVPRYEDPIDTISSLAESNIEISGLFEDWILSIKEIKEDAYGRIVQRYTAASEKELRILSKQSNRAFFMERLPYSTYGINDFMKADVIENYHLMKEDIYWEYTEFFLRKSSELAPSFDIFILRVLQSGITSHWQRKAVYRFLDPKVQKIVTMMDDSNVNQEGAIKLKFSHIEGSFALLFIGYFLSVVSLITERLIYRT